ncbi:SDR family oxidoreductase [Cellulomonas sp. McL0617]|uniref:SDR family oxidoreductase n=1 Tax=Cellulomonas sp. McL0617 TaxID=3415675 RepID=UPI003CF0DAAF
MTRAIAVTGATGAVGRLVAEELAGHGILARLVVRDPAGARLPAVAAAGVRRADYADAVAGRAALAGVDVLFMVSATESADRLDVHRTFVDAAADAGVRHIVYTSFLGASPDATFTLARDHWATEEHIRASGMTFTFLRDGFYLDFLPDLVGPDGVIRGPAGTGRVAAVARADVARSAVAVLRSPDEHRGAAYDLTGPDALSLTEVAAILTEATGTDVRFHDETIEEAYASRASYGAPRWQVDSWVSTYTAIAAGELARTSDAVRTLTGRRPTSLRELLAG